MSIKAVNQFAPEWYTPKSEKGADKPARFQLVGLDGIVQSQLAAEIDFTAAEYEIGPGALAILIRNGVRGWENVTDGDKKPLPFPEGEGEAVQRALSYFRQAELARQIFELTFLQPADKKK